MDKNQIDPENFEPGHSPSPEAFSFQSKIQNPKSKMVSLVGAGPGHPGLLTLRAVECLREAELVLYDRLVPVEMLVHAPVSAKKVCVDELPGCHPERWPLIHQTMIDAARAGQRVVRLKGGDPLLFGRGGEEAQALRSAGIAYEIVPGVTAALGAAACAGIPLTHRLYASAVAFVTGHEQPGKLVPGPSGLDWSALARFPGTLVFYMAVARIEGIVDELIHQGKPVNTPAAVIHRGSTPLQRTVVTTLGELPAAVRSAGIEAPSLVVVGEVVRLREELAWCEARPLFGKRVLVTRPRHQAAELAGRIEALGGQAVFLPTVTIAEPEDWSAVDRALDRLADFHWLVFTSTNGVHAFIRRLRQTGRDLRALGGLRLAVIGPATAEALRGYHLEPDVMPASFSSEHLAADLRERVAGQHVLLSRADRGIELLREELSTVASVEQVAVYCQRDAPLTTSEPALRLLSRGEIDFVTLTSSNIARALIAALDHSAREHILSGKTALVCISPRTGAAVRELDLPVAAEASEYTTQGVLSALCGLARTD
jgi:uroporphyrinogen III methyltransferase/synthase